MKEPKLYKNKYLIGIYNAKPDDDSLIALLNNRYEFAEFMNISLAYSTTILKQYFEGRNRFFRLKGSLCEIVFIKERR